MKLRTDWRMRRESVRATSAPSGSRRSATMTAKSSSARWSTIPARSAMSPTTATASAGPPAQGGGRGAGLLELPAGKLDVEGESRSRAPARVARGDREVRRRLARAEEVLHEPGVRRRADPRLSGDRPLRRPDAEAEADERIEIVELPARDSTTRSATARTPSRDRAALVPRAFVLAARRDRPVRRKYRHGARAAPQARG